MSSILSKPFKWTNMIARAVFKGNPSLFTTSDLNRQIVALKKEMQCLQESCGAIISDFTIKQAPADNGIIAFSCSYVYCSGVKFSLGHYTGSFRFDILKNYYIYLKASTILVSSANDSTKEISGAKFEDGTVAEAADHYVYRNPSIVVAEIPTMDSMDDYPDGYVCTLARVYPSSTGDGTFVRIESTTVPVGKSLIGASNMFGGKVSLGNLSNLVDYAKNAIDSSDSIRNAVEKLNARLYNLERRQFYNTSYPDSVRSFTTNNGTGKYIIVGSICFLFLELNLLRSYLKDNMSTLIVLESSTNGVSIPVPLIPVSAGVYTPSTGRKPSSSNGTVSNVGCSLVGNAYIREGSNGRELLVRFDIRENEYDSLTFNIGVAYPIDTSAIWNKSPLDSDGNIPL